MKKIITLGIVLLGFASISRAQGFYDLNTIQEIRIYFGFSNWDYRMDTATTRSDSYTMADSVVINGVRYTQCGVKYKGNSSYSASRAKNPMHIKLDFTSKQDYQGFQDIKLANGFSDPSMTREPLAYYILRQYMDAPRSNYAKVYVNGTYYGVMCSSEDIGNSFNEEHYFSSTNAFFKCNPLMVSATTGPTLQYLGANVSSYQTYYELQSDSGWNELVNFCDTLNNNSSVVAKILDVDRALWMHAFNNVLINLDSYSGAFRQNYYLYRDHNGRWIPTVWDLNMCFGSFTQSGGGAPLNLTTMRSMTPNLHKTDATWPLINKLLSDPMYYRMYIAHMRTINSENFSPATYKTTTNALHTLVDNAVSTDPNYLYTYLQFQRGLDSTTTGGGPMGGTVGIYQLMDPRATYLNSTAEFGYSPPVISSVAPVPASAAFGSNVTIIANVTNRTTVYLGYRYKKQDVFTRIQMYDDGAHNDGASGDDIYGVSIPCNSLQIQYYIYADNSNAGMFSPQRAEHEFYTISPSITQATSTDIVINEFTANNSNGLANEEGKHKDWIEFYNPGSSALGMSNIYLSDTLGILNKWRFPADAFIPAGGYLLVWADDKDVTFIDYHTNFNLSNSGDHILLSDGTSIGDSVIFGDQGVDSALARCPDGTGPFENPASITPRTPNSCRLVSVEDIANADASFLMFPNPAQDHLEINANNFNIHQIEIFSLIGEQVFSRNFGEASIDRSSIDLKRVQPGVYFVRVNGSSSKKLIVSGLK